MAETPPNRPHLRDLLEPAALHPGYPVTQPDSAWELEVEASKAISLKRIADALAPTEGRSAIDNLNEVLTDFVNNLSGTLRDARN